MISFFGNDDDGGLGRKKRYRPDSLGRLGQGDWVDDDEPNPFGRVRDTVYDDRPDTKGLSTITNSVGMEGRNDRTDVAVAEKLLHQNGVLDTNQTKGPTGYFGTRADQAIRTFQKDQGLKVDGLMLPNGPTIKALQAGTKKTPTLITPGLATAALAKPKAPAITSAAVPKPQRQLPRLPNSALFGPDGLKRPNLLAEPPALHTREKYREDGIPELRPTVYRENEVWENGEWRPKTDEDRRKEQFHLMSADGRSSRNAAATTAANAQGTSNADVPAAASPARSGSALPPHLQGGHDGNIFPPRPTYYEPANNTHGPRVGVNDWLRWNDALDNAGVKDAERHAYQEIYSAEGGATPDGTTTAGITQKVLNDLRDDKQIHHAQNQRALEAAEIAPGTKSGDLTAEQRAAVYRLYMDDAMRSAGIGAGVPGHELLNRFGDRNVAAAIADTLFREGAPAGARLIQQTVNKLRATSGAGSQIETRRGFGSETFRALRDIAADPASRNRFLNLLAERRRQERSGSNGDAVRADRYRIRRR